MMQRGGCFNLISIILTLLLRGFLATCHLKTVLFLQRMIICNRYYRTRAMKLLSSLHGLKQTRIFHHAAQFTYAEFPEHFTWHGDGKFWDSRRGSRKIGRVAHVGPNQGESYYLRMLLHIVKGAKSFSDVRTVEGHRYPTFQDACQALGLLGDDP